MPQEREVVEPVRHVGMDRSARLLEDPDRPLVQRLRPRVIPRGLQQGRQIVETLRHVRMRRPQRLLPDVQRALVERPRSRLVSRCAQQRGQVVEALRDVRMGRPQDLLPDAQHLTRVRHRLGVPALAIELHDLGVEARGGFQVGVFQWFRRRNAAESEDECRRSDEQEDHEARQPSEPLPGRKWPRRLLRQPEHDERS
jgi:hypothetical protein